MRQKIKSFSAFIKKKESRFFLFKSINELVPCRYNPDLFSKQTGIPDYELN